MKILYHGDSPTCSTGFGNVSRHLLGGLHEKGYEITVIGINDMGGWKDPAQFPYRIYPAIYDDYKDLFGVKRLIATLAGTDPEIKDKFDVLVLNYDFFLLQEIKLDQYTIFQYLKEIIPKSGIKKTILYTPIDNPLITKEWLDVLRFFNVLVVPSTYGKNVVTAKDPALGKETKVIPYGLDIGEFYPLPDDDKGVAELKKMFHAEKKFIVGYVGRNQWRKDIYRVMKVFAKFHAQFPQSFLYIHAHPTSTMHDGGNLFQMGENLGLHLGLDYATPQPNFSENKGFDVTDMNKLYNMMDVFLSASTGEGFGLPMVEAQLAGVPVVAPDNTTVPELVEDKGLIYKNNNTVCFGWFDHMRERPLGDIDDALDKVKFVHAFKNNPAVERLKDLAMINAKTLTVKRMVDSFVEILGDPHAMDPAKATNS